MRTQIRRTRTADLIATAGMVVAITVGLIAGPAAGSANAAQPPATPAHRSTVADAIPAGHYRAITDGGGDTVKFTVGTPAADGTQPITHVVYFYAKVPGPMPLNDATLTNGHFEAVDSGPATPFTIDATYSATTQAFHGTAGPRGSKMRRTFDATLMAPGLSRGATG